MKLTRWIAPAVVAGGALVFGYSAFAQPTANWATVGQIFADNCTRCHGGATPRAGLNLTTYAGAIAGSNNGPVLIAGNAAGSLLVRRIRGEVAPTMPRGAPALSADTIATIVAWVTAGMPQ